MKVKFRILCFVEGTLVNIANMSCYLQLKNKTQINQNTSVLKNYPTLVKDDLKLSTNGLSVQQRERAWKKVHDYLHTYNSTMIGFQTSQNLQYSNVLNDFMDMHVNNAGDPFNIGYGAVNTKVMECAVLDYFAKLWNIELSDSMKDADAHDKGYWGYVVSMGCTEANLYALYNARNYLEGKPPLHTMEARRSKLNCQLYADNGPQCDETTNSNAFTPVVFYSEDAHYSLDKAIDVLRIHTFHDLGSGHFPCPLTFPDDYPSSYSEKFLDENGWPRQVPVGPDGSMYLPSLVKLVTAFVSRGHPPIVIFTLGATFKGNYENPKAAISQLVPILKQHNLYERRVHYSAEDPSKFDVRRGFWFHVDGALGGGHLPFLEMAMEEGLVDNHFPNGFPEFDFRIPEVMSIAMSLHKWFGCPFPAGIYMTRRKNQVKPPTNPLYTGCGDTTFAGSRNGHALMTLWDFLSKMSYHDLAERAARGEKMVKYSWQKLQALQKFLGEDLWLTHSPGSLFICFKEPRKDIVRKYSLACTTLLVKTKKGELERRRYSHICVMAHVHEELIEQFIEDLREQGTFPTQDTSCVL